MTHNGQTRRALFLQPMEPGAYPPLVNAARLLADAGWKVFFLSAPILGQNLLVPAYPNVLVKALTPRPSHVLSKISLAKYLLNAGLVALRFKPHVVYGSDPMCAAPVLLASRIAGAAVVYHEHDSPSPGSLRPSVARLRR